MRNLLFSVLSAVLLGSCALAPLEPAASAVRVVSSVPAGCTPAGRLLVSVTSRVGPVPRNALRVKDELENLARNQAQQMGANAVMPVTPITTGDQTFEAYRCVN